MGLGSMLGMLAGISLATGNGLSYLDGAGTCAACKAKGLDMNSDGQSICSACPYYEFSIMTEGVEMDESDENN